MNIIDKAVAIVSPKKGLERIRARAQLKSIDEYMNYGKHGGSKSKTSMLGWFTRSNGPEEDINKNLDTLRERSRDLYMGNPVANGIIKKYRNSVVGHGLVPRPHLDHEMLGINADKAKVIEKNIKKAWEQWAQSTNCDSMRMHDFYNLQGLACLSWIMNGDVFVIPQYRTRLGSPTKLCIQILEGDQVTNTFASYKKDRDIKKGVELNKKGEVVAYHILDKHPGDGLGLGKSKRIKAFNSLGKRNIYHIFEPERPGQRRGVPLLAPVLESLKQLTRYSEAELQAAVISGMYGVFLKQSEASEPFDITGVGQVEEKEFREHTDKIELGNGMVSVLKPGEEITDNKPGRPNANYKLFVDSIYEEIGAGVGITKEVMLGHFTSSYSAARASLEEAWRRFLSVREMLVRYMCQPIYDEFLLEQVALGKIELPGFMESEDKRRAYSRAIWIGANKINLDPWKEIKAQQVALELNVTNREIISQQNGHEWNEVIIQKQREDKLIGKAENEIGGGESA